MGDAAPRAAYVFAATLRLSPEAPELAVDPPTVEVTVRQFAAPPGEEGWLFFRDHCWRGELSHPDHVACLLTESLGVPVASVAFRELRTTESYRESLRAAVADDLAAFNADDVDEALHDYLGSSVHVVAPGEV